MSQPTPVAKDEPPLDRSARFCAWLIRHRAWVLTVAAALAVLGGWATAILSLPADLLLFGRTRASDGMRT